MDADFNLNAVRSQQTERQEQSLERLKQEQERTESRETRTLQASEANSSGIERTLQIEERAKAQAERARFAQQRQSEANEKRDQMHHKVMKWLSRLDTINAYLNALVKQSENPFSCRWIFDTAEYRAWVRTEDPINALWINSGPGTGKTILAGQIVRQLREDSENSQGTVVAFYFCNGVNASKDDPLAILRTILCQLLDSLPKLPEWVTELYRSSYLKGSESAQSLPFLDIQDLLDRTLDLFESVYIILDGIDELSDRKDLLTYLTALGRRGVRDKVKVLVISRMESDVRQAIGSYMSFAIHPSNTKNDMRSYIARSIRAKLNLDPAEVSNTENTLSKRARGMFIWVRLVIDLLADAANAEEYHEILREIPQELHEIYCLIVEKIHKKVVNGPPSKKVRAKAILRWLALSFRPLRMQELQEALATEDSVDEKPNKNLSWEGNLARFRPTEKAILDVCGNLIDEENGTISLLHHTAREFLVTSSGYRSSEVQQYTVYINTGNAKITVLCLTYLINTDSSLRSSINAAIERDASRDDLRKDVLSTYPFYEYACRQWPFHFGRCPIESNPEPLKIFPTFQLCTSWYQGWSLFHPSGRVPHSKLFQRLRKHGAAVCAWLDLLNVMLGGFVSQSDVSLDDITKYTVDAPLLLRERCTVSFVNVMSLETAAKLGYHSVVSQILKITSPNYSTVKPAFNSAISKDHAETIAVLCEYLATRDWVSHPLEMAQAKGDKRIEKVLLKRLQEKEADIEQFLGIDAKKSRPRAFRMLPVDDANQGMFDRPYWESVTPVSDGGNYLAYRESNTHKPRQHHEQIHKRQRERVLPRVSATQHTEDEVEDVIPIHRRPAFIRMPASPNFRVEYVRDRLNALHEVSTIVHEDNEDGSPRAETRQERFVNEVAEDMQRAESAENPDLRLAAYYLLASSPTYAYSSTFGPHFHPTNRRACRPSKVFPHIDVAHRAVRERTWPVLGDISSTPNASWRIPMWQRGPLSNRSWRFYRSSPRRSDNTSTYHFPRRRAST